MLPTGNRPGLRPRRAKARPGELCRIRRDDAVPSPPDRRRWRHRWRAERSAGRCRRTSGRWRRSRSPEHRRPRSRVQRGEGDRRPGVLGPVRGAVGHHGADRARVHVAVGIALQRGRGDAAGPGAVHDLRRGDECRGDPCGGVRGRELVVLDDAVVEAGAGGGTLEPGARDGDGVTGDQIRGLVRGDRRCRHDDRRSERDRCLRVLAAVGERVVVGEREDRAGVLVAVRVTLDRGGLQGGGEAAVDDLGGLDPLGGVEDGTVGVGVPVDLCESDVDALAAAAEAGAGDRDLFVVRQAVDFETVTAGPAGTIGCANVIGVRVSWLRSLEPCAAIV